MEDQQQPAEEKMIPATLIPGDGIGPEIVEATVMVLEALGRPISLGSASGGDGGSGGIWRPAAATHLGQHTTDPAGAEGAA